MKINYSILQNLLKYNKSMKLEFKENSNTLDLWIHGNIIFSLELDSRNIENHSEIIYNAITSLEGITMYIPKIYIKEE